MPYCFPRSSIKFQGHTGQNITDFDPNWAFPDYRPVAAFKSLIFALFESACHGATNFTRSMPTVFNRVVANKIVLIGKYGKNTVFDVYIKAPPKKTNKQTNKQKKQTTKTKTKQKQKTTTTKQTKDPHKQYGYKIRNRIQHDVSLNVMSRLHIDIQSCTRAILLICISVLFVNKMHTRC